MIDVEGITRRFGTKTVLNRVSFHLDTGEVALLTGANGAGKTTLLRILSGYAPAETGRGKINGLPLFYDDADASTDIRRHIGYVAEGCPLYDEMKVGEYLRFRGRLKGIYGGDLRRAFTRVVDICGLGESRADLIRNVSHGVRARVSLADALLSDPPVLLLDDPLAAVDAVQRRKFYDVLRQTREHRTVIFASHTPDDSGALFSRVLGLAGGKLVLDDPMDAASLQTMSIGAMVANLLINAEERGALDMEGAGKRATD